MTMRSFRYTALFSALTGVAVLASCLDLEELPDEPVINEIWFDTDAEALNIRFTDGDGDFGLAPRDTMAPFQLFNPDGSPNYFHFNMHIEMFYRIGGIWEPLQLTPIALGFVSRIPNLTPQGQSKQLRVLVTRNFSNDHLELDTLGILQAGIDTVKYRAVLIDRALNTSLEAESAPVIFRP